MFKIYDWKAAQSGGKVRIVGVDCDERPVIFRAVTVESRRSFFASHAIATNEIGEQARLV